MNSFSFLPPPPPFYSLLWSCPPPPLKVFFPPVFIAHCTLPKKRKVTVLQMTIVPLLPPSSSVRIPRLFLLAALYGRRNFFRGGKKSLKKISSVQFSLSAPSLSLSLSPYPQDRRFFPILLLSTEQTILFLQRKLILLLLLLLFLHFGISHSDERRSIATAAWAESRQRRLFLLGFQAAPPTDLFPNYGSKKKVSFSSPLLSSSLLSSSPSLRLCLFALEAAVFTVLVSGSEKERERDCKRRLGGCNPHYFFYFTLRKSHRYFIFF